jgi:mannosyl-3-phosphoglycerate phosphatase
MIVLSDLDGTLLNHDDYAYDAAKPALEALREHYIPLILCSSKTSAEIILLRGDMGFNDCPAIVENGGGILKKQATDMASSSKHKRLMNVKSAVSLAIQREYSEPGLWFGDEKSKQEFISALKNKGVVAHQGGRFLTLSFDTNKAVLAKKIINEYQSKQTESLIIVALGDAPNDIEMLDLADIGVIIPNPAHHGIPTLAGELNGQIVRATKPGAAGWNSMMLTILNNSMSLTKTKEDY